MTVIICQCRCTRTSAPTVSVDGVGKFKLGHSIVQLIDVVVNQVKAHPTLKDVLLSAAIGKVVPQAQPPLNEVLYAHVAAEPWVLGRSVIDPRDSPADTR